MLLDWGMQRNRPSSCVHKRGGVHGGRSCSVTKNTAALVFQVRLMLAALNHLRSVRLDELVSGKACTTKLWPKVCRHSKPALPIECIRQCPMHWAAHAVLHVCTAHAGGGRVNTGGVSWGGQGTSCLGCRMGLVAARQRVRLAAAASCRVALER